MDLLKALKRTTIISAAALLALGATEAQAVPDALSTITAHMSASIATTLAIAEVNPMNFGNMAPVTGAGTLVLGPDGKLTATTIVPLDGGTGLGSGANAQETAAQHPGFFNIITDGTTTVYVSFANISGDIIDPSHPTNSVPLFGPDSGSTVSTFTVDTFTVANDDHTTGYVGAAVASTAATGGGYYPVVVNPAGSYIRVGATLHASGAQAATGRYAASYYVMVSY